MIKKAQIFSVNIFSHCKLFHHAFNVRSATLICLTLAGGMYNASVLAGECAATTGTKTYNFVMDYLLEDPTQNTTGKVLDKAFNWNLSGDYNVTCSCASTYTAGYVTAKVPDTGIAYSDGHLNYYNINEYLAAASEVWIRGEVKQFVATPFTSVSNGIRTNSTCNRYPYSTGSKGWISLYFKRPFVGVQTFPPTKVVDVFIASDPNTQSTIPVSTVWMSGTVKVPQSCEINGGGIIRVPFGDIMAGDIATKGEMAKNFTPKRVDFNVACTNISDGVKVSLSFQGTPDKNDPTALSTTNADVGVRIQDTNGATIAPLYGLLPLTMNYVTQMGTSAINLFPFNTSGKDPEPGDFTATATVRAEIE